MRRSVDFQRTVRSGVRAGRRTVVVHAYATGQISDCRRQHSSVQLGATSFPVVSPPELPAGPRFLVGFVVSKSTGNAVCRNRTRRRLQHLVAARIVVEDGLPGTTLVVVRALPPAATAGPELGVELDQAWSSAMAKLARRLDGQALSPAGGSVGPR